MKKHVMSFIVSLIIVLSAFSPLRASVLANEESTGEECLDLFSQIPSRYSFASGIGAWCTTILIHDDGTFEGRFTDIDYEPDASAGYNSELYYSFFHGKFSRPRKVNEYTYSFNLDYLIYDCQIGMETIELEGDAFQKKVAVDAYGIEGNEHYFLYTTGATVAELPEEFISCIALASGLGDAENMPFFGLYCVETKCGFFQSGGRQESSQQSDYTEAYRAYLELLTNKKQRIDLYTWQKGYHNNEYVHMELTKENLSRPVAICDIYCDGTPELIYIEGDNSSPYNTSSILKIVTYKNGSIKELYSTSLDEEYAEGVGYYFFQIQESNQLYFYYSIGDDYGRISWKVFNENQNGQIEPSLLYEKYSYIVDVSDDGTAIYSNTYKTGDSEITAQEYEEGIRWLENNTVSVLMYGTRRPFVLSFVEQHGCPAMTCDEAIAYLNEKLSVPTGIDIALEQSACTYDYSTALISSLLSLSTYSGPDDSGIRLALSNYGFEDKNIYSNNYGGSLAFTIGVKPYLGSDAEEGEKLVVIAAQGSTNPYELLKDATALTAESYNGYLVYDIVRDFRNAISEGINHLNLPRGKYKVLLTGHSLGGAAVNLVAAMMDDGQFGDIGKENIYCYTFGAINPILSYSPVEQGYENIHNVYNLYDTFSSLQFGLYLPTGMGTGFGKFGHMDIYSKDNRSFLNIISPWYVQIADHINHDMDKYYNDVRNGTVENSDQIACLNTGYSTDYTQVTVACPVDIRIIDADGNTLAYTEGENVYNDFSDKIIIRMIDDTIDIFVPDNVCYSLEIIGTGEGTMNCSFKEYDLLTSESKRENSFENVKVETGALFRTEVSTEKEIRLFMVENDGALLREIYADGTIEAMPIPVTDPSSTPETTSQPTAEPQTENNNQAQSVLEKVLMISIPVLSCVIIGLIIAIVVIVKRNKTVF